ncbi:GL24327 [Drosophila persimilis]|uniref:GL24327 n=1 Tax=Drosophila persimilis TaxID=7234 RepID=B4G5A0_DROPE|nr:GL24327 [Drosophila persimilis]
MRPGYISAILLWLALSTSYQGTVLGQLFQGGGYYYPPPQPSYPGYYRQTQGPRPQQHQRSYKDICRLVNTNGFTNPGGVPRCPY